MSSNLCVQVFEPLHTAVHSFGMTVPHLPELLNKIAEAARVKQTGLGTIIGVSQPQISRYIKQGAQPSRQAYDKILEAARRYGLIEDVRSEDVASSLPSPPQHPKVKVKGYVGAGAAAHFYALSDEDFEEVDAPVNATDQTVAVEIKGTSLGPLMNSWLVFYDDIRSPVTSDLIGRVCVVGLADDRILVKQIKRERNGTFTLISNTNEDPIRNAQIEWAARVTDMRPRY